MPKFEYVTNKSVHDWGTYYRFMSSDGHAFGRAYIYADDPKTIILDSLNVSPEYRRQGRGLDMQLAREDLGRRAGCEESCLVVKKDTWMMEWYKRRGYVEYQEDEHDSESVWMHKRL